MTERCRICDQPATTTLGAYRFCEQHYERALRQRGSLWRADLLTLVALVVFVVVVYLVDSALDLQLTDPQLLVIGVVLALVPAALWLLFFWRRDRLEPEPAGLVLGVTFLGALVAAAVARPLVQEVFDLARWIDRGGLLTQLGGQILVAGIAQMTLVYLVVRLSVYRSLEFDEWTDGILYGTAAGLGYATWLNIDFIATSGGAQLGLGAVRVVLTALVLASLGGLVGYFLGHDRLEVRPVWYVPAGVALAAILDGLFWYLRTSFSGGFAGLTATWVGLILAALLALAVTWFLSTAVSRELARAVGPSTRPEASGGLS